MLQQLVKYALTLICVRACLGLICICLRGPACFHLLGNGRLKTAFSLCGGVNSGEFVCDMQCRASLLSRKREWVHMKYC